ncbi:MAG: TolC family protein [Flavobacteriia bacterium]|nr:TolC family protein [Flavobacteriia bacterium]OIP46353.1 MAG: transporter [Flavobacteriaceae bacterium CG2_30_31_66]PIV95719.1 MAG: transporter [Flavobacteriaceae bacterium CG17_big_fil_post_rev_8_21_14_2_50_31_13]PIY15618.1 MAG: transporter [Flavobacteriaceae bacterium CG_4_10_14_3_um_filter_31_253]PIZ09289.1 MAG: transporter [Flavobacteriaceae bacterium CG_4_10_14_0_8_um_filter_31_99]PJC09242.1 MAG: transporter [Flavobacteriaceae bacterium CG_4_9_14_0_8_um_filter_31_91]
MKYNMKYIAVLILILYLPVNAQEIISIDKSEVIIKIKNRNLSLKISAEEFNKAQADYRQTNAIFLPNITASHTGFTTTNPLMAFGSKLNQGILTQADFNPALLNNPTQTQNFATIIKVEQPLINMDGVYQRKAAKSKMKAMSLQTQRTEEYLVFEVEKAYMELQLAYKAVTVLEKALQAANENQKLAENSFKQGYLQRADVLNVEVRVTEVQNQLQQAKSNVQNASNYLSFLMNEEAYVQYIPSDELNIQTVSMIDTKISENRSDIKAMQLASNAYGDMNKAEKMTFLPRLNAFGSYELYDNKIFQADANGYLVGAQLSWDLFNGSKRFGKVQKSKAEFEKSKLEYDQYLSKSNLELNKAKRMLMDAENKLNLSKLALTQSEESLRIRTNRFKEGLEKTTDLLAAETQFSQKQLEYYQTIFEYNYAQAYLKFLTKE